MNDDDIKRKGALEGIPIYEAAARDKAGPFENLDFELSLETIYRFALCNCGFTPEDLQEIGVAMITNLVKSSNAPLWRILLQMYLVGLMDGAAMQSAQAAVDAQQIAKGRVN